MTERGDARPRSPLFTAGSLTQRLIALATAWIAVLLLLGGFALDRVLTATITRNFDAQLSYALTAMIASAEFDPIGEIRFTRSLGDQRFFEPQSGLYWQVSAPGADPFASRSLWDRRLSPDLGRSCIQPCAYNSREFRDEPLRIVERDAALPGSQTMWRFQVASASRPLDEQIAEVRSTLFWALGLIGGGLLLLAITQATIGLRPLRRVSSAIAAIRSGAAARLPAAELPPEIAPLAVELNELLEHNERQSEQARMQAGNLAHALKTPMSVLLNEAAAASPDLPSAVLRETAVMRRHVDHHLARARAAGRRAAGSARVEVWPSLEALKRAIERIYADRGAVIDIAGDKHAVFRGERQDLEEMLGNLIDNAAKYGGGRVFVTIEHEGSMLRLLIEDDGAGIGASDRSKLFGRGARLDTGKPGTGLGLAIVRDVAEIYGGSVELGESEDLGGLLVTLRLPAAGGDWASRTLA